MWQSPTSFQLAKAEEAFAWTSIQWAPQQVTTDPTAHVRSLGHQKKHLPVGVGVREAGAERRAHRGRPSLGVSGYDF